MEETIVALQALYTGTNPVQKQQANQWLQEFVTRVESWTVCDQLLRNPTLSHEGYYFAAQTLHTKVVSSLDDLPAEARLSLRQSLLEHLARFKAAPQIITVQLSLALAALAVQMEGWANPVQDVTQHFAQDPTTLSLLLDFLTVLPDECENQRIPITNERRKRLKEVLVQTSPTIVSGLISYSRSAPGNLVLQNRVFSCLMGWIKTEAISLQTLSSSEFVGLLFDSLGVEALFDIAVDALCEIVLQTRNMKVPTLVETLLVKIPQLIVPYRNAVASDNTDVARGIARLFVGAGEAYLFDIIASFEVYGILTELILECTAHKDLDIAQISFNFWFQLAEELPSGDHREVVPKFFSAFSRLMGVIIEHLKYPNEATQSWTAEQRDDFRDFRHVVGDTLKDCCAVLGGQQALQLVYEYLGTQLPTGNVQWQSIEAGLFAIRSMASGVDMKDSTIIPKIMDLILSEQLPKHSKIRYTTTLILGRYANWSKLHPAYLQRQIEYIVAGFVDDEVCPASALALKHLTKACDSLLAGSLQALLEFHATNAQKMKLEDILEITEAIANLVSVLPADQLPNALQTFWFPIAKSLDQLSLAPGETSSIVYPQLLFLLDRLTIFVKHLDPNLGDFPHPLVALVSGSWPIFNRLFDQYGNHPEAAEKLCRCMKYIVKACKLHFQPMLETLVARLIHDYRRSLQSGYLYAGKEVVYQFGTIPGTKALLIGMLSEMSAVTFGLLQRHENFVQHPDIVEDYFMFVKEYLESCPHDIVPFLDSIFQCGLGGLTFNHREAIESVITFFDRLLVVARRKENESSVQPVVVNLVNQFGYHLVHALLQGMSGIFPSRCNDDIAEIIKELMEMSPEKTQQWIETGLSNIPAKVSVAEKKQFLHDVYHLYKGNGFTKVIKSFGSVLKQRR